MAKLNPDEVRCAMLLQGKGQKVRTIARQLGVAESTLRCRLKQVRAEATDGRSRQPSVCDSFAATIQQWMERQVLRDVDGRWEPVKELYHLLMHEGFTGSYRAVLRYVSKRRPVTRQRPKRRVETAPGAQVQIDWVTRPVCVEAFGGVVMMHAFIMTLSHSRMWAVIWSRNLDLLSWLHCHNQAFVRLGGVTLTARIDNLKTGVASGSGVWAKLQIGYASYASQLGFAVDPCRVRQASDKGKVERRGRDLACLPIRPDERFADLAHLQQVTDQRVHERAKRLPCPVTGTSMHASWQAERGLLLPLPMTLPEPFDVEVTRPVHDDCLVHFEGRHYSVPFVYVGRTVHVRGGAGVVSVWYDGKLLVEHARHTDCRLLVDQAHYDGPGDERVMPPVPLGVVGRRIVLQRSWEHGAASQVAGRGIDHYAQLVRAMR
ncbi:MAG: IS21 family transposase [Phycisphaeraceae bacterium]